MSSVSPLFRSSGAGVQAASARRVIRWRIRHPIENDFQLQREWDLPGWGRGAIGKMGEREGEQAEMTSGRGLLKVLFNGVRRRPPSQRDLPANGALEDVAR